MNIIRIELTVLVLYIASGQYHHFEMLLVLPMIYLKQLLTWH